jgi:GT2 family glycosyltransferase
MKLGSLSIIIVAHNKAYISEICLRSLLEATFRPIEVIFVDNGSSDRTSTMLEGFRATADERGIHFRSIRLERNFGGIIPRNQAMQACDGDWIAFLDNDVIIRSRSIFEDLILALVENPKVGVVTPKFVYPCPPYRIQCAGGGITREGDCYLIGRGAERDQPEFNYIARRAWAISACMVMSADLIRMIGPMDEVFNPIGCEDVDYCFRVRVRNRDVIYLPGVEIYHLENTSTFGTPTLNIQKAMKRNQRIIKRRWAHMFPPEPSVKDELLAQIAPPRVPVWMLDRLPLI